MATELNKVRTLERRFGKKNAVVGNNSDRITEDMRKPTDQGLAVELFELIKLAAIDNPGNHFPHIERLTAIAGDNAIELCRIIKRFNRFA